jgi:YHS domain-containing protein
MKKKIILIAVLAVIFGSGAVLFTPRSVLAQTNTPSDMPGNIPAKETKSTPYALTTCVVSGEKLGEMGAPIEFIYTNNGANQEIKFCCPMCKSKFLKDPDSYMKKIHDAEAAAQK